MHIYIYMTHLFCSVPLQTISDLQESVLSLQRELNETGELAIRHSERLRSVRSEKRTIDLKNSELIIQVRKAEVREINIFVNQ